MRKFGWKLALISIMQGSQEAAETNNQAGWEFWALYSPKNWGCPRLFPLLPTQTHGLLVRAALKLFTLRAAC